MSDQTLKIWSDDSPTAFMRPIIEDSPIQLQFVVRHGMTFRYWEYVPQPDITAYELALILPIFMSFQAVGDDLDKSPNWPQVQRHFKEAGLYGSVIRGSYRAEAEKL